ncbi:MAG TPA: hypothetical protein VGE97_08670 [Nitrososphaera sp.]|jgi:hypothetical protein
MAKTVNLTVRVDDTQFKQFMAQYNAFSAQIKNLTSQFTQIQSTIQKTTQQSTILTTAMRGILNITRPFVNLLKTATGEFFKWSTLIGGISALLGMGGGLFGIERLAAAIMQKRKQVLGLGGTFGGVQAANIFGQSIMDNPQQVLTGIRAGTGGAPEQLRALAALGIPFGTQKKPEELLPDVLMKVQDLMKKSAPGTELMVGRAYGLSALGFSDSDLIRLKTMSRDEIKKFEERMLKEKDELSLSEKAQKAWTDLEVQFKNAKSQLMSTFGEKLADLAKPIGELSDSFVKLVKTLMNTTLVDDAIKLLVKWLNQLSDYLKGDTVKEDLQKFVKEVESWGPTLKKFKENMEAFATTLGNIIDVLTKIWRALFGGPNITGEDLRRRLEEYHRNATTTTTPDSTTTPAPTTGPAGIPNPNTRVTPPVAPTVPAPTTGPSFTPPAPPAAPPSQSIRDRLRGGSLNLGGNQNQFASWLGGPGGNMVVNGGNASFDNSRGGNRFASWNNATQRSSPDNVTGYAINNQRSTFAGIMGGGGGRGGGPTGPLDTDNWQMTRTASLVIRNTPGSNIYANANTMSG